MALLAQKYMGSHNDLQTYASTALDNPVTFDFLN